MQAADVFRVVLVDDDPAMLRIIELGLRAAGMECRAFVSPREALCFLLDEGADVLVVDRRLGSSDDDFSDGLRFCRKLRAAGIDIPSILLTAAIEPKLLREAFEAGISQLAGKSRQGIQQLPEQVRMLASPAGARP